MQLVSETKALGAAEWIETIQKVSEYLVGSNNCLNS